MVDVVADINEELLARYVPKWMLERIYRVPAAEGRHARGRPPLTCHPRNPRQGDVGAIIDSIRAHGFYTPLIVQTATGHVLAGNHRLLAARTLNMDHVPVVWYDCDDEEALRVLLVDNRLPDMAKYDEELLAELLVELADTPTRWTGTGYGDAEIADLLKSIPAVQIDPSATRRDTVEIDETYDTLPYYGGKNARRATCRFILGLLPLPTPDDMWIEPCGGLYGVGLHRPEPRGAELLNDLNGRVVNWWRTIRDQTDRLERLIKRTPSARLEFDEAIRWLREHHPIDRALDTLTDAEQARSALYFTVVLGDSIQHHDGKATWSASTDHATRIPHLAARIAPLAERMASVRLDHRPAIDILARWQNEPRAITYLDPPYIQGGAAYPSGDLADHQAHAELLLAQNGRVLVSGYRGDWHQLDDAGWHRHELTVLSPIAAAMTASNPDADPTRIECVWTNYDPPQPQTEQDTPDDHPTHLRALRGGKR